MRPTRKFAFHAALAAAIAALAAPVAADDDSIYLGLNETESVSGQNTQIEIDDVRIIPGFWVEPDGKFKGGSTGVLAVLMPAGTCHVGKRYRSAEVAMWDRVHKLMNLTLLGCLPPDESGSCAIAMSAKQMLGGCLRARASRGRPMQIVSFGYTTFETKYR